MPLGPRLLSARLGRTAYQGLEERGGDISLQMAPVSLEGPGMALGDPEGVVTGGASGARGRAGGREGGRKRQSKAR